VDGTAASTFFRTNLHKTTLRLKYVLTVHVLVARNPNLVEIPPYTLHSTCTCTLLVHVCMYVWTMVYII